MKSLGVLLVLLGGALALFVFVIFGAIHTDARLMLHDRYAPPQPSGVTYEHLYHWTMVAMQHGIDAENFCGYLSAAFLVAIGVILLAWARDRNKLRSHTP